MSPEAFKMREPGLGYRQSVEALCNDRVLKASCDDVAFQRGAIAIGLLAFEREGAVTLTGAPMCSHSDHFGRWKHLERARLCHGRCHSSVP